MTCQETRELLSPYLDDELAGPIATQIDQHLRCCSGCRRNWAELRASVLLVGEHGRLRCPEDLTVPVLRRIEPGRPRPPRLPLPNSATLRRGILATAAAATLLVAVGGAHFIDRWRAPASPQQIATASDGGVSSELPGTRAYQWHEHYRFAESVGAHDAVVLVNAGQF